jgi:putative tricarboxylic transport membrane protein
VTHEPRLVSRSRSELASAGAFLALSIFAGYHARELGLGSVLEPGPGLYPFILAIALAILSLVLAFGALRRWAHLAVSVRAANTRQIALLLAALVGFVSLLPVIGFALVTAGFLAVSFRIGGMQRWNAIVALAIALGVGAAAVCALIGIPLPRGLAWQWIAGARG